MQQLKEGNLFDDRYLLIKLLGSGGFSEVWLAEDTKVGNKKTALKIYAPGKGLDDDGVQLFSSEFEIVFDLNHSHLLRPAHFDVCDRSPYLLMPYCERGSAGKLVGRITEEEAWHFLHDVASGLEHLHAQQTPIIHQDIKPDNVLIDNLGRYLITDFGISAKARSTLRKSVGNAKSGGTIAYMPPERFGKDNSAIKASDVWALGATVFELLTGDAPFGDHGGLIQRNGAEIPNIDGAWSDELKEIVVGCLHKDAWDRPTAMQIVEWTEKRLKGEKINISSAKKVENLPNDQRTQRHDEVPTPSPTPSPLAEKSKKKPVGKYILVAASVVIGILLLVFFGTGKWQSNDSDRNAQITDQKRQQAVLDSIVLVQEQMQQQAVLDSIARATEQKRLQEKQDSLARVEEQKRQKEEQDRIAREAEQKRQKEEQDRIAREAEQKRQQEAAQSQPVNTTATTSKINIEMVTVQGGTFTMGCTSEQGSDCFDGEKPAHQVTVSSFSIGKYPVTQAQWKAVMGSYPSELYNTGCDDCPVDNVSWNDIQEFIKKLNAQSGKTYRLPTEAEWEFASRGGLQSAQYKYSGSNNLDEVAWYAGNYKNSKHGSQGTTHPVGKKKPNELGIYDMSGNVFEWCSDWLGIYPNSAQTNPKGPSSGSYRVLGGGSWISSARCCRVSFRSYFSPGYRSYNCGFRLASVP